MIVDREARRLLKYGVLKSYSVGIGSPVIIPDPVAKNGRIVGGELMELSLCDVGSCPEAGITILKAAPDGSPRYVGKVFGPGLVKGKKKKHKAPLVFCTGCGLAGDPGERYCTGCGQESRAWSPLADKKLPMNQKAVGVSKKQQKRARKAYCRAMEPQVAKGLTSDDVLRKSPALAREVTGMLEEIARDDPSPAWRAAAASALSRPVL
jgi:hypothetical protein